MGGGLMQARNSRVSQRQPAVRILAQEFGESTLSEKGPGEFDPAFVITKLGAKVNRLLVAGLLERMEPRDTTSGTMWQGQLRDASGVHYFNIGHFDNEIRIAGLEAMLESGEVEKIEIKPQVHEWKFKNTTHGPDGGGHSILILAEGRLVNLGCATGHPSLVMSASFTNQTLAQIELHQSAESYGKTVAVLPKHLDERVAELHLQKFGAQLTELTTEQADYIGVDVKGPFKANHYRY